MILIVIMTKISTELHWRKDSFCRRRKSHRVNGKQLWGKTRQNSKDAANVLSSGFLGEKFKSSSWSWIREKAWTITGSWTYPGVEIATSFDVVCKFSTPHRMVRLRSSLWFITDPVWRDLFLNAHHNGSLPMQLKVFWGLLLQADPEGPALIFCAASWRTISNKSPAAVLSQKLWYPFKAQFGLHDDLHKTGKVYITAMTVQYWAPRFVVVVAEHVTNSQIAYSDYNASVPLTHRGLAYGNSSVILPVAFSQ